MVDWREIEREDSSEKNEEPDEDVEEFEVEKILDKRIDQDGRVEYYLKWLNFNE